MLRWKKKVAPEPAVDGLQKEIPVNSPPKQAPKAESNPFRPGSKSSASDYLQLITTDLSARKELVDLLTSSLPLTEEAARRALCDGLEELSGGVGVSDFIKVVDYAKSRDLLFWASSYNLFIQWSPEGRHPWDSMPGATGSRAVLEIGQHPESGEAVVLLSGMELKNYDFSGGVLRSTSPVQFECPCGTIVPMNLQLQLCTFTGYGEPLAGYLGAQCHGVMWPDCGGVALPLDWPMGPPRLSGKVNVSARSTALSSTACDPLSTFAGKFMLSFVENQEAPLPVGLPKKLPLTIEADEAGVCSVSLGSFKVALDSGAFDNNVLSWQDQAGYSAWLHFTKLASSFLCLGILVPSGADAVHIKVYGEPEGVASCAGPDASRGVETTAAELSALSLGSATAVLASQLLKTATRSWQEELSQEDLSAMKADAASHQQALTRILGLATAFNEAFPLATNIREISPEHADLALTAAREAAQAATAARVAGDQACLAEKLALEAAAAGDETETSAKAAVAAWRASQAADAAVHTEEAAHSAAHAARCAHTRAAIEAALAAAQSFNTAKAVATEACAAQVKTSEASLQAVEAGIAVHCEARNYLKLKDIAEASGLAARSVALGREALDLFARNTPESRLAATEMAKDAAESAQLCYKFTRSLQAST